MLYDLQGRGTTDEIYTIPLGVANYTREGGRHHHCVVGNGT